MSTYTHTRGKVKIKPQFVDILRPRFTKLQNGEWVLPWTDIALPEEIKNKPFFQILSNPDGYSGATPGTYSSAICPFQGETANEDGSYSPRLLYSEDGHLDFMMAHKNRNDEQEAFIRLLLHVSDTWRIEKNVDGQSYECWIKCSIRGRAQCSETMRISRDASVP